MQKLTLLASGFLLGFWTHVAPLVASPPGLIAPPSVQSLGLEIVWNKKLLKSWSIDQISKMKRIGTRERDPKTERMVTWEGVLLGGLVQEALEQLTPDERAHVDLVILKNGEGGLAPIPRFLLLRYPLLLAVSPSAARLHSVVPWSSKPNILKEGLPLDQYFLSNVRQIELANDEEFHSKLILKRRTDPSAIRGEKVFIRSCAICHDPADPLNWTKEKKPTHRPSSQAVKFPIPLSDRDWSSVINYRKARDLEHSQQP